MTSNRPTHAYVWIWLPEQVEPVIAGRIDESGDQLTFVYGRSYLERLDAIPLLLPDLPLQRGVHEPRLYQNMPGPIADAMPDAWGRQVVMAKQFGTDAAGRSVDEISPITYLLAGGPNRIGALGFSHSNEEIDLRNPAATIDDLSRAAQAVENNEAIDPGLAEALLRCSSVGGAWPKALLDDTERPRIAKFATRRALVTPLKYEYVAMKMARLAGIVVADVELTEVLDTPVLLVDRFDRVGPSRRQLISCLSTQGYSEDLFRYCTYVDFAHYLRRNSADGAADVKQLFRRIMFNMLVSNTDDHAKNHSLFGDGQHTSLTPAYDIAPQMRSGGETVQAMAYGQHGQRLSNVHLLTGEASLYLTSQSEAHQILEDQIAVISDNWSALTSEAGLTKAESTAAWGRQFLNNYTTTQI